MDADDPRLDRLAERIASSPHNLVSHRERARVRDRHIDECVAVGKGLASLGVDMRGWWIDLGTGAGLPGLVLALMYPETTWTLIDSVEKKVTSAREFAVALGLQNVRVVTGRAEELGRAPDFRGSAQGVVVRALAPLRVLVELARGFVGDGGILVAVKGPAWEREVEAASTAIGRCGWHHPQGIRVSSAPRPTWLVTLHAVGPPPPEIPRRVGVPRRRPL